MCDVSNLHFSSCALFTITVDRVSLRLPRSIINYNIDDGNIDDVDNNNIDGDSDADDVVGNTGQLMLTPVD